MEGRRYLRCLGQPALFSPTGEPVRFRTKKHLALLVYLAVEGRRAHRRDRLAELFWPHVPAAEGRHSLATALSILRPRLGVGAIEANRDHVVLTVGRLDLDLDRLVTGEIITAATQETLEVAGFLEGFEIPDSVEFAMWKDRQQAHFLPAIKAGLVQLIDRCRRTADARQIEHLADTMLSLDDLSEEAVRAKMEARAFAGDRLTALRIFEEWKTKLSDTVGAQPSHLVEGMAVRLRRRGWERTNLVDIPTVPTDQWRGRSFIGRSREYRMLYEGWEETKRGRASHALVLGDSGIGKSTLVDRLTTAAGLEGAAISRAQCYDLEREIPYATLGNLVHGLLDRPGVSGTPPEALAELARSVGEVRRRFPTIPVVQESQGENARLKLTEAFHQMLETIAEEYPVILVVDDLHLCDEASLSVLHLVMHRVRNQGIMLVLVARAGELPRSPQAARLRTSAQSLGIQEIALPPLSEQESGDLLAALLNPAQDGVDTALHRTMIRAAGGFPMVLELLVQDWEANGDQSLALALDAMTADFGSDREAPAVYRQVLDRLIYALDHGTRNVLNVAAVLGHRLNDLSLYSIADLGPGQVMAAMADLVRHRVLRDGGRGLEFINEFVRAAAYLEVPSPVRRALHTSVAERLMEEEKRGVRFLGLEIAWHTTRAGRAADVPAYLLRGATEAIAQGALDAAARALGTALRHLAPADRTAAALLLTEVLQEQGRWSESAAVLLSESAARSSAIGTVFAILAEHRTTAPAGQQLARDVGRLHSIVGSVSPIYVRLKAASAAAQLMGDVRDQSVSHALLGAVEMLNHDNLTEDEQEQLNLCRAQLLYYAGRQREALEVLTTLVASFHARGIANSALVRVYTGLGAVRCYEGKYEDARTEYSAGHSIAVRIGNEPQQAILAAQLALCCLRLGEYDEQLEWSRKAAAIGHPFSRYQELQAAYYQSFALAMRGDVGGSLQTFATMDSRIPSESPPWLTQAWKLLRADILCLCGQHAAALSQAREALALPHPVLRAPSFAGVFARWLALVSEREGTLERIHSILDNLGQKLDDFDAIDRVEITCARLIASSSVVVEGRLQSELAGQLVELSPAVVTQLDRLGALRVATA
jgi:DNA-binding SARP family transcriptional activator/tetratricopeptide (TPR) repeat protein